MKLGLISTFILFSGLVNGQQWHTDLAEATQEASAANKNILVFFSVADACDACRRLDNIVFKSEEFQQYANQNLILVKMDFQAPTDAATKAKNLMIVEKYNKDGFFPWVVVIDKNGKVLGKADMYDNQSPQEYLRKIKNINN
ncbi:thioredoxin family protein [Flavobacterium silvaticum]|uniref:Thioredoxin family protein n=1 Tax=Flavobacterium silvaticum TaxID=1852020 RepID=A0A972JIF4_9FLAO|nr:thioredoxin family protein [Flavobacterium silvaticum]NMH28965.1 thioredoxin family protein [Flavobacterium silvaticum]